MRAISSAPFSCRVRVRADGLLSRVRTRPALLDFAVARVYAIFTVRRRATCLRLLITMQSRELPKSSQELQRLRLSSQITSGLIGGCAFGNVQSMRLPELYDYTNLCVHSKLCANREKEVAVKTSSTDARDCVVIVARIDKCSANCTPCEARRSI